MFRAIVIQSFKDKTLPSLTVMSSIEHAVGEVVVITAISVRNIIFFKDCTLNVHGIAGLGGALNYLSEIGTEAIIKKERSLIKRLEH